MNGEPICELTVQVARVLFSALQPGSCETFPVDLQDAILPNGPIPIMPQTSQDPSPLLATVDQLRGWPSTLLIAAEFDFLREEGEAYTHMLLVAEVLVQAIRCIGRIHDFVILVAL